MVAIRFMHQSGCAADLKTGARGDVSQALALESQGIAYALASAAVWVILAATFPRTKWGRAGAAFAVAAVFYVAFFAGAVQVHSTAIVSCP